MMKVLSIGTDENVFDETSIVRKRLHAYAESFGALDQVVLAKRKHASIHDGPLLLSAASARLRPLRLARGIGAVLGRERPDVVTTQDPFETGLIGLVAAWYFKAPLHVQVHTDFLAPTFARHSMLNRLRVMLARHILQRARGVRVVSESIKRSLIERWHITAAIAVLPIFIDTERFAHATPSPALADKFGGFRTRLLVVGRLEPEKNVSLALDAFKASTSPEACLIIVGSGSERDMLETHAHALGIHERVFFEGTQDPAPYYALADLLLVPSRYEGYGLVIVEALAAGKPVLSNDVGIARQSGAIVTDEDHFGGALREWFAHGPRTGILHGYPYRDFADYVSRVRDDVAACMRV